MTFETPGIAQVVERRLHILAEELPFDAQRIKAWAFCKTVLSIAWTIEDHGTIPEFEVEMLSAIDFNPRIFATNVWRIKL